MENYFDQEFLSRLERLTLKTRKIRAGKNSGERRSPQKGHSVEFADFRSYSRGDDVRYIDWNSYARSEKLFIKLFMEEQDLLVNIFLDNSKSMDWGEPSKNKLARQLAGAFSFMALSSYDQVAIAACSDRLNNYLPPLGGRAALPQLWNFLSGIALGGSSNLSQALKEFGRYYRRPGLSVIISDLLSAHDFKEGLKYLQYLQQDIILLQVLSPDELNPVLHGDWRLVDSESGESREVTVSSRLIRVYNQKLHDLTEDTRNFCHRRGMAFLQISSEESFEDIILRTLPRAGILG